MGKEGDAPLPAVPLPLQRSLQQLTDMLLSKGARWIEFDMDIHDIKAHARR